MASQKRVVAHKRCFIILIIVLQGNIRYQVVGEYPAPSLFSVDPVSGQVQIIRSVREDTTATVYNVKYYYWMKTYCLNKIPSRDIITVTTAGQHNMRKVKRLWHIQKFILFIIFFLWGILKDKKTTFVLIYFSVFLYSWILQYCTDS